MGGVNQVLPNPSVQPSVNLQNFGSLIGEVNSYVKHIGSPLVANKINDALREIYDRRRWYGTMVRGQIVTTGLYSTGGVTVTFGSASVQGNGTNWTDPLNGTPITQQQFRLGFTSPFYNIIGLDSVNQVLTLDMPFGNPTQTSSGYLIYQLYYSFPGIQSIFAVRNLILMYRLVTGLNQSFIDNVDPSRLILLYPRLLATMTPDALGNFQAELWPANTVQQALPFEGWTLPPKLVDDSDNLPAYIRADAVKAKAIADVLMMRPKSNPDYSENMCLLVAQQKLKEFEAYMESMEAADEGRWRQNVTWRGEQFPCIDPRNGFIPGGAFGAAMMPYSAEDY